VAPLDPVHERHLSQMREDVEAFLSTNLVEIDSFERDALQKLNVEQLSRLIRELAAASIIDVAGCFHDSMNAFACPPMAVVGGRASQDSGCAHGQRARPGCLDEIRRR
jgi:hypothetical protein